MQWVIGLTKAIAQYAGVSEPELKFSRDISDKGKALFDPHRGGRFGVFVQRPVQSTLLIYSAYDSRQLIAMHRNLRETIWKLDLKEQLSGSGSAGGRTPEAPNSWGASESENKVFEVSQERVNHALDDVYTAPESKATFYAML
eukprot:g9937.t1